MSPRGRRRSWRPLRRDPGGAAPRRRYEIGEIDLWLLVLLGEGRSRGRKQDRPGSQENARCSAHDPPLPQWDGQATGPVPEAPGSEPDGLPLVAAVVPRDYVEAVPAVGAAGGAHQR